MESRFPDIDVGALDREIAALTHQLTLFPQIDDPRSFEPFLSRARARYVRGEAVRDVVNDLRCAAICRKGQANVLFCKVAPHRLRTRRLDPMHLALHHADPELVEQFGGDFGLPLMTFYAGAASADLEAELALFSSYFRTETVDSPADLVGLAVATYASGLGALMRGDDHEAVTVFRKLNEATAAVTTPPPDAGKRYLLLCAALADLAGDRSDDLAQHLAALSALTPLVRDDAPDLSVAALAGLACLMNVSVDLAPLSRSRPDLSELAQEVCNEWERVE